MTVILFPNVRNHARAPSNPNSRVGGFPLPLAASARSKSTNLSAGMRPRSFQLETADVPTPAMTAVAAEPPKASMMDSTEVSIPHDYSRSVNKSSLHNAAIFTKREKRSNPRMSRSQRDIAYRLELTREALGVKPAKLCRDVGMAPNQWSQYVDPDGLRRITIDAMYRLKDEYGVTFDWIFDGDRSTLPGDLREKIRSVERSGIVDLSRARGRRTTIKRLVVNSRDVK